MLMTTTRAVTMLNQVQGIIGGYVAIWGDSDHRDAYDTFWDRERPAEIGMDFLPVPICYEHAQDGTIRKEIVGSVESITVDDTGYRFTGRLDKSSPYFERMVSEINNGELKTSSASAPHMVEFYPDGAFKNWPLVELSLTKTPAEERMPAVSILRSAEGERDVYRADGNLVHAISPMEAQMTLQDLLKPEVIEAGVDLNAIIQALLEQYPMEDIMAVMQQMQPPAEAPAMSAPATAPGALPQIPRSADFAQRLIAALEAKKAQREGEELRNRITALEAQRNAPPEQNGERMLRQGNVSVSEPRKFWGRSLEDLMFVYEVEKSRNMRTGEELISTIAGRMATAIEKKTSIATDPAIRSLLPATRSDEIVTSTNTGNGDEWIGVAYSSTLWEKARNARIYQDLVSKGMRVEEVQPGMETVTIFTEGADPTVYTITQSADLDATGRATVVVPVTAPGTGQVLMTPGYLGMAVAYTSVFEEDSLIAAASQLNTQMQEKAEETIEQLFINGDTAATLNVNYDGDTAPATAYYKASNGARKYAIVTGSGTSRDGGALDENDFRLTLKLFPSAIRSRKSQMAFILESDTHNTALDILAAKTQDVRGSAATIDTGVLAKIYGVDVYESGFLPLTDTDGKVTYNAAGTKGTILGIYAPFWAMGWKRRVTIETDKDILSQANYIVATFRLGFLARGAGAAVASYNLTIA